MLLFKALFHTFWISQEFNIEKLQLVEAEKKKIRQEYERKEKQVEIRKKMYVFNISVFRATIVYAELPSQDLRITSHYYCYFLTFGFRSWFDNAIYCLYSEYSMQLNASRIEVLQSQDDLVSSMKEAAAKELLLVSVNQQAYQKLLKELIVQVKIMLEC
ncbi:hypothetical protein GW17_00009697 [Ensete ventricosum]|nr:hypothetical protein GW17_00009697 [Ensete ventricosum]